MRNAMILVAGLFAGVALPAHAAELRELCPDRPGLNTPPCIVDAGHLLVEGGTAYSHDRNRDTVDDEQDYGELTLRLGVTRRVEVLAGWTAHVRLRSRDRASGEVTRARGGDDLLFGAKIALTDPDAKDGVHVSVQPFATAPMGKDGIGADGWTQGIIVPVAFDLPGDFKVQLSPEIDRVPDSDARGHHGVYTGVVGLGHKIGPFDAQVELFASRDDDPGARSTQVVADANLALGHRRPPAARWRGRRRPQPRRARRARCNRRRATVLKGRAARYFSAAASPGANSAP